MTEVTTFQASKRYSPLKFTKSAVERSQEYSPSKYKVNNKLHSTRYYCHYSNSVYMGGADSFKKNGQGIIFMDSGACAVTKHSHDNMIDFNIVFRDKSMSLVTIKTNKSKYVSHRTGPYLLAVHYNQRGVAEKTGYLLDFKDKKIYKLTLYASKVDKKQEMLSSQLRKNVFEKFDLSQIIEDADHLKTLKLNFNISPQIQGFYKDPNLQIGFVDKEKSSYYSNGLSFRMKINRSPEQFDVILEQRGYFVGDKMEKYGEKHFQNGNYYVGGFKNGLFEGYGMLVYPSEQKWVYGVYKKGQMVDLIQSSVNSKSKVGEIMRKIHDSEDSYIQLSIKLVPSAAQISQILKCAIQAPQSPQNIQDFAQLNQRTNNNYTKIKDDFVRKQYESNTEQIIKEELSKEKKKSFRTYVDTVPIKQASPEKKKTKPQQNLKFSPYKKQRNEDQSSKISKEKYQIKILPASKQKKPKIKKTQTNNNFKVPSRQTPADELHKNLKTTESSSYSRKSLNHKEMVIKQDPEKETKQIQQQASVNKDGSSNSKYEIRGLNIFSPSLSQGRPYKLSRPQEYRYLPYYSGVYQDMHLSGLPKPYYEETRLYTENSMSRNRHFRYLDEEEMEERVRLELANDRLYRLRAEARMMDNNSYY